VVHNFLRVFTGPNTAGDFLDDLQWADVASLSAPDTWHGNGPQTVPHRAYRDNEVGATHPRLMLNHAEAEARATPHRAAAHCATRHDRAASARWRVRPTAPRHWPPWCTPKPVASIFYHHLSARCMLMDC
jgi:hypothetical protein